MQNTTRTQTGDANGSSYSGRLDTTLEDFARTLNREGYVITGTSGDAPLNYRDMGGVIGHDDFRWAANRFEPGAGGSMAAYLENGDAFDGAWFFHGANQFPSVHFRWYTDQLEGARRAEEDRLISRINARR